MTASWQLPYTGSPLPLFFFPFSFFLFFFGMVQYSLKVIQEQKGWRGRNITWINRNQTVSAGAFGTLSGDMRRGVRGEVSAAVATGFDKRATTLSQRQVVMHGGDSDAAGSSPGGRRRAPEATWCAAVWLKQCSLGLWTPSLKLKRVWTVKEDEGERCWLLFFVCFFPIRACGVFFFQLWTKLSRLN